MSDPSLADPQHICRPCLILGFHNTIKAEAAQFAGHDPDLAALAPLDWDDTDGA